MALVSLGRRHSIADPGSVVRVAVGAPSASRRRSRHLLLLLRLRRPLFATAAALASHMADPGIGRRLPRARRPVKPVASAAPTLCMVIVAASMADGTFVQFQPLGMPLHAALAPGATGLPPLVPVLEMQKPGMPLLPPSPALNMAPVAAASMSLHLVGLWRPSVGPPSRTRMINLTRMS
jgi:hypothetical protein